MRQNKNIRSQHKSWWGSMENSWKLETVGERVKGPFTVNKIEGNVATLLKKHKRIKCV